MKIAFLYPEVYEISRYGRARKEYPPFGVMYLAAVCEQNGHNVEVYAISHDQFRVDLSSKDVVCYSLSASCTYSLMLKSFESSIIAEKSTIIIGGVHATLFPKVVLHEFHADYVIRGEGEIALNSILKYLAGELNDINIPGIITVDNYEQDVGYAPIVSDLDSIPYPARHLLPEEDVIMTGRLSKRDLRMVHILTSRGCPFHCYFCGGLIKKHRYRSGRDIANELNYLIERYGIEGFVINDENFIINNSNFAPLKNQTF